MARGWFAVDDDPMNYRFVYGIYASPISTISLQGRPYPSQPVSAQKGILGKKHFPVTFFPKTMRIVTKIVSEYRRMTHEFVLSTLHRSRF
jgi:hypothetical protein